MSDSKKKEFDLKGFIKEYVPYVIVIVLVLLFKRFVIAPIRVNGESMMTTLHDKDIMILNRIDYKINGLDRFDIVVIDEGSEYLIKRVIGLPGENVTYKDNVLYIDGKKVKDNFGSEVTEDFSIDVPEGRYFVLGDNRTNSLDSRYFGPFLEKDILGKTNLTLFPFNRIGKKK